MNPWARCLIGRSTEWCSRTTHTLRLHTWSTYRCQGRRLCLCLLIAARLTSMRYCPKSMECCFQVHHGLLRWRRRLRYQHHMDSKCRIHPQIRNKSESKRQRVSSLGHMSRHATIGLPHLRIRCCCGFRSEWRSCDQKYPADPTWQCAIQRHFWWFEVPFGEWEGGYIL